MIITNSLGSNYTAGDRGLALKLLFQPWKWQNGPELEALRSVIPANAGIYLNRFRVKPGMTVELFLKGRHAIYEALRGLEIGQGNEVIVQAFTCVAVVQPILDLGAIPVYIDVAPQSLNPTFSSIKQKVTEKTKAVILQHTLGFVNPETKKIVDWCKDRNIYVIQDLAHAFGANTKWLDGNDDYDGKNSSHHPNTLNHFSHSLNSDAIILSFSQDKVIDGVSGGGLVTLNSPPTSIPRLNDSNHLTLIEIEKNLLYPICTWLIRSTYKIRIGGFSIGKGIHWLAKLIGLMNSPIDTSAKPAALPNALAAMTLNQLNRVDQIIAHRRDIALIYDRIVNKKFKLINSGDIKNGSCLRYPLWVENRDGLESKLTKHGFYLMDHWYDAPVSPEWVDNSKVKYRPGSCPNAENLSRHIFNLPTHINISLEKAKELVKLVNLYGK